MYEIVLATIVRFRTYVKEFFLVRVCKNQKNEKWEYLKLPMAYAIILFLTVSKNKIAAMPENIGVVAILTVVLNYSILFSSFTFFLDGFHLAFCDKFEICIKTTDLM